MTDLSHEGAPSGFSSHDGIKRVVLFSGAASLAPMALPHLTAAAAVAVGGNVVITFAYRRFINRPFSLIRHITPRPRPPAPRQRICQPLHKKGKSDIRRKGRERERERERERD